MTEVQLITHDLLQHLKENIREAKSCYILTSFVMKSGVKLLEPILKEATEQGTEIKICTGDYLYITQPEALTLLHDIHEDIEIRLWKSNGVSFHPKAYLLESESTNTLYVGSSNMSNSALTTGVEWNLEVKDGTDEDIFEQALKEYFSLFHHESTIPVNPVTIESYSKEYKSFHKNYPVLHRKWTKQEEIQLTLSDEEETGISGKIIEEKAGYDTIQPRFAQIPALEELQNSREEGYNKAMVVMATGLGKTYLAAFFAKSFKRVLFIAHLEEILYQSEKSFKRVLPDASTGIYNGKEKNPSADIIFASVQTLSRKTHLERFSPDAFDLIIVDEFHHAAANSYQKVLAYFNPEFLLGITATPDRNDYRDIYAICEGNVAYRIEFIEAVNKKWLAPFSYYGVYDETDYSSIRWLGTRYDADELAEAQLKTSLAKKILKAWEARKQTRTLVFCSSILQADFLSSYFNEKGYRTISLHSQSSPRLREKAIQQLKKGQIDAIMTVNLFNEGVDIPEADTLLFVRPTESLTVFTQQIGRGLRLAEGKSHCVIIDLIANYRNADVKQSLLYLHEKQKGRKQTVPVLPDGCEVDFDLEAKNLLIEMSKKKMPRKEQLLQSYYQVKADLGRRPTYLDMHMYGSEDSKLFKQEFKSYFSFLDWADELTEEERRIVETYSDWLYEVERTGMSKSYKMVLLLAMLERGAEHWAEPIKAEEAAPFFHKYLTEKPYRKRIDFSDKTTKALWEYDERKIAALIVRMPMTKWSVSSKGLLMVNGFELSMNFDIQEKDKKSLYHMTKEICEYRLQFYFERTDKIN